MDPLVHFSTVHPRGDTRIAVKEVGALAAGQGRPVLLYVQDGLGDESRPGYRVVDTGPRPHGRLARMTLGAFRMWRAVRAARPALVHFHDPELIPVGLALKLSGIRAVYDVHEDLPRQIESKYWLPAWLRRPVAAFAAGAEFVAGRCLDGIVAATPSIAQRFPAKNTVTVRNFPLLDEWRGVDSSDYQQRSPYVGYVGGLSTVRGARQMVEAIERVSSRHQASLLLAGGFSPESLRAELEQLPGWTRTQYMGWCQRAEVAQLLARLRVGLVLLHPTQSYREAYPVKLFEYMSAGLPVIASDFPLWRSIIEPAGCGLLVDPLDPAAIAQAIDWLLDHPEEAQRMGERGREAVQAQYNWASEAEALAGLYRRLLTD